MSAITIFEGPDGGGKTTAALRYAEATNALYYHFSAWRHMGEQLPRLYVEAMAPALMGLCNVVLDRSWLSEEPYNVVYRGGEDSLVPFHETLKLERLAMRCDTLVVFCLPPVEVCIDNFNKRREREMLDSTEQLVDVYNRYKKTMAHMLTSLPTVQYDYTRNDNIADIRSRQLYRLLSHPPHCLNTVGSFSAPYIIVGDLSQKIGPTDPLHRWPTIGFNQVDGDGIERFAEVLFHHDIGETDILWIDKKDIKEAVEVRMGIADEYPVRRVLSFDPDSTRQFIEAATDFPWAWIFTRQHPDQVNWKEDTDFFAYYNIFE